MTASVYCGPHALFAAPNLAGTYDTMVELRVQQDWSERFTQILQSNMGWDANTPVGTGSWYGLYLISIYHINTQVRRPPSCGMVRRRQGHANRNRHQLCRGDPRHQLASGQVPRDPPRDPRRLRRCRRLRRQRRPYRSQPVDRWESAFWSSSDTALFGFKRRSFRPRREPVVRSETARREKPGMRRRAQRSSWRQSEGDFEPGRL